MIYEVQAYGIRYAQFSQQDDAEAWAKLQSEKFSIAWWEVHDEHGIYIAFCRGELVYDTR